MGCVMNQKLAKRNPHKRGLKGMSMEPIIPKVTNPKAIVQKTHKLAKRNPHKRGLKGCSHLFLGCLTNSCSCSLAKRNPHKRGLKVFVFRGSHTILVKHVDLQKEILIKED